MFAYVRFYYGSIYTGTENGMDFIILSTPLNNVERQALLLYQAQTVAPLQKHRDRQLPILYLKNALLRWGIFVEELTKLNRCFILLTKYLGVNKYEYRREICNACDFIYCNYYVYCDI